MSINKMRSKEWDVHVLNGKHAAAKRYNAPFTEESARKLRVAYLMRELVATFDEIGSLSDGERRLLLDGVAAFRRAPEIETY